MKRELIIALSIAGLWLGSACERVDHSGDRPSAGSMDVWPDEVAQILSHLPIGVQQMEEVKDAVGSSSGNGYDEEYMMKDLFTAPGAGVGDDGTKAREAAYERPLKDLFAEYLASTTTKAGMSAEEYMAALESSGLQIYWPYYDNWDGKSMPVITYDPEDGSSRNTGWTMENGEIVELVVDEALAMERPVWVVNRNDDSVYSSLEMRRREDPSWGSGSGGITITKSDAPLRTLILKDFKANRNYDPWFSGASEFFIKCAAVENFTASTEAELRLYEPSVTDFMVVVRRKEIGQVRPFNAVLVSEWTDQLETCAFMITEDDGGTVTSWKCSAEVKIKSKTYGFDMNIPFNSRDDIVWRGQLSGKYFEKYNRETGHFGDVDLTFEILE